MSECRLRCCQVEADAREIEIEDVARSRRGRRLLEIHLDVTRRRCERNRSRRRRLRRQVEVDVETRSPALRSRPAQTLVLATSPAASRLKSVIDREPPRSTRRSRHGLAQTGLLHDLAHLLVLHQMGALHLPGSIGRAQVDVGLGRPLRRNHIEIEIEVAGRGSYRSDAGGSGHRATSRVQRILGIERVADARGLDPDVAAAPRCREELLGGRLERTLVLAAGVDLQAVSAAEPVDRDASGVLPSELLRPDRRGQARGISSPRPADPFRRSTLWPMTGAAFGSCGIVTLPLPGLYSPAPASKSASTSPLFLRRFTKMSPPSRASTPAPPARYSGSPRIESSKPGSLAGAGGATTFGFRVSRPPALPALRPQWARRSSLRVSQPRPASAHPPASIRTASTGVPACGLGRSCGLLLHLRASRTLDLDQLLHVLHGFLERRQRAHLLPAAPFRGRSTPLRAPSSAPGRLSTPCLRLLPSSRRRRYRLWRALARLPRA